MGRRRGRRRVIKIRRPRLPKFFKCPVCDQVSVSVKILRQKGIAMVTCGVCGFHEEVELGPSDDKVDAYAKAVDKYYASS